MSYSLYVQKIYSNQMHGKDEALDMYVRDSLFGTNSHNLCALSALWSCCERCMSKKSSISNYFCRGCTSATSNGCKNTVNCTVVICSRNQKSLSLMKNY